MLSRRHMFGLLAAAPVAAKAAAQEAAAGLAGMQVGGLSDGSKLIAGGFCQDVGPADCNPLRPASTALMRLTGVPDWLKREWRERARNVNRIDPDIAALQSMSLAGKIAAQRARNYEGLEANFWRGLSWEDARTEAEAWRRSTGIGLWG